MDLTDDAFRALARSSPERWRSLHLVHRGRDGEVEAWLTRPGELRFRRDGVEQVRTGGGADEDLMVGDYRWLAMLDPVELSHHVALSDLRVTTRHGRPTWWAQVRALEGYDARCACCALVWSEHSDRELRAEGWVADPADYPSAYEVGLDAATGVVVSLRPVDGPGTDPGFSVEIRAVAPLSPPAPPRPRWRRSPRAPGRG